jgi:hypothetical protein
MAEETEAPLDAETEEEEEAEEGIKTRHSTSVNIIVRDLLYLKTQSSFKSGGSFKIYEDQVKSDANAMQVLDDTGKVLMNIVMESVFFQLSTLRN